MIRNVALSGSEALETTDRDMIAFAFMVPDTPPTAEGDLEQTPFAHLCVYAIDRRLTGELFLLESADGEETVHAIRFDRGCPVKIRVADGYARLGDLLVEDGAVSREVVEDAVKTGGLLGDMLVLSGLVDVPVLEACLVKQFRMRMTRFFALPATTKYKYFEKSQELAEWGGDPASIDAFELLWAGVRAHGSKSALFAATLERFQETPLRLHERADIGRFGFEEDASLLAEVLAVDATTMAELAQVEGAGEELARLLVYVLAITRQLDVGRGALPVGVEEERSRSLAKVRLRSQVHRAGAALDAPAADGERSVRSLSVRGRAIIPRDDDGEAEPSSAPQNTGDATTTPISGTPISPPILAAASPVRAAVLAPEAVPAPEASPQTQRAPASEPTTKVTPAETDTDRREEVGEESTQRLRTDTLKTMSATALLKLAREKLDEKDVTTAAEVADFAVTRMETENDIESVTYRELVSVRAWARAGAPQANLKAMVLDLDDAIRAAKDTEALPRYVRGLLRKRLGDNTGALNDFKRTLELDPSHALAQKEVASLGTTSPQKGGLLKKLFGR